MWPKDTLFLTKLDTASCSGSANGTCGITAPAVDRSGDTITGKPHVRPVAMADCCAEPSRHLCHREAFNDVTPFFTGADNNGMYGDNTSSATISDSCSKVRAVRSHSGGAT